MPTTATVVCQHKVGSPARVVRVEKWEIPPLQPTQVRVRMEAAPIHPADLNVLEGKYPISAPLPRVVGNEGVGVVVEVGSAVTNVQTGQRVIAPVQLGAWCEQRVLEATTVYPIPHTIAVEQAAMLAINLPTAWRMLHDFVPLRPGDWLIQNAANSAVGRLVIQLARHLGWRTVNVVRRTELIEQLQREGADIVLTSDPSLPNQVTERIGRVHIQLGLNAVGGESARQLARCLSPGGTLVTYGAMSRQPLQIENSALIFRDLRLRGFWISEWYRRQGRPAAEQMFGTLLPLAESGIVRVPVEQTFPLEAAREAVEAASRPGRHGKILFRM